MRAKQVCRAVLTSRTARLLYGSYNVRKFRHLPRHLAAAELTAQLNDQVLLNYSWLYHKCRACSFDELLSDFTLAGQQTEDRRLVLAALRAARPHVGVEAASLAAELAGRLLSFVGASPAIRRLVADCDRAGVERCALVPNFQYRATSGGPLNGTIVVDGRPTSYAVVGQDHRLMLVKDVASPIIQVLAYTEQPSLTIAFCFYSSIVLFSL